MDAHIVVLQEHPLPQFWQTLPATKSNRDLICISGSTIAKCQLSLSFSNKGAIAHLCEQSPRKTMNNSSDKCERN